MSEGSKQPPSRGSISTADAKAPSQTTYRFLLGLSRSHRWELVGILLTMVVQCLVALAIPWLAGRFSGALLAGQPVGGLLAVWFAVILVQVGLGYAIAIASQSLTSRLVSDTSVQVFDHLQSLPLGWHGDRRRGEVLALLTEDVNRLAHFVTGTLTPLAPLLVTCVGAFVMMVRVDPAMGLAVALVLPVIFAGLRLAGRWLRPLSRQEFEVYSRKWAIAEQNLSMLPIVKAFAGEAVESQRYGEQASRLRDVELRQSRLQNLISPVARLMAAAGVMLLLWFCSHKVTAGVMAPAELITLLLYGLLLTQPLSQLAAVYGQTQSSRESARRLVDLFAQPPEPDEGTIELGDVNGEIVFERVEFAYPGRPSVYNALDLHLRAGETVAITGPNGAGKSTLAHLLLRFADPVSGRILLDGIDTRSVTMRSLRSRIGLVSQSVLLFHASVAENIAYGHPDATRDDVERAARAARAHEFVAGLPDGYDTVVGDQGMRLSGGQRQRIALARALLKDPAVLVLDEATAMFDPEGEREFIAQCHELLARRTVLLITHRPASLKLADRVLRLEGGRLWPVSD